MDEHYCIVLSMNQEMDVYEINVRPWVYCLHIDWNELNMQMKQLDVDVSPQVCLCLGHLGAVQNLWLGGGGLTRTPSQKLIPSPPKKRGRILHTPPPKNVGRILLSPLKSATENKYPP